MESRQLYLSINTHSFSRAIELVKQVKDVNNHGIPEATHSYLLMAIKRWCQHRPQTSFELIKALCEAGADVQYRNHEMSIFIAAVMFASNPELITYLQSKGADFEHPIFAAAWHGDQVKFDALIEDYAKKDSSENTVLHYAVAGGNVEFVKYLVEKNFPQLPLSVKNNHSMTPLQVACRLDHLEIAKYLQIKGANPSEKGHQNYTTIHFAALKGAIKVLSWLIENKHCQVSERASTDDTPLIFATTSQNQEMVKYLLAHGSHVTEENQEGKGALYVAAMQGDLAMVQLFLANNANLRALTKQNETVLHVAAEMGELAVVKFILEKDPELASFVSDKGYTPLLSAAKAGYLEVVKYLSLLPNANLSQRTHDGCSLIHLFAACGSLAGIQWLVNERGVSISEAKISMPPYTPLWLASGRGNLNIVEWIIKTYPEERTKKVSNLDFLKFTILSHQMEIFKFLVEFEEKQLDPSKHQDLFNSILNHAILFSYVEAVNWLLDVKKVCPYIGNVPKNFLSLAVAMLTTPSPLQSSQESIKELREEVINLLLSYGAGIKADITNKNITPYAQNAVLIGAKGVENIPGAIHTFAELKQAIAEGVEFNLPALKRTVDIVLRDFPDDAELLQTSQQLAKYVRIQTRYPTFNLQAAHAFSENGFSLFSVSKQFMLALPKDLLINIVFQVTKLDSTQIEKIYEAVMKHIFQGQAENVQQFQLKMS